VYLGDKPDTTARPGPPQATAGPTYEQQAELTFWATVKDSKDPTVLQVYLDKYPSGTFADLARQLIAQSKRESEARRAEAAEQAAQAQRAEAERKARDAEAGKQQDQLGKALEEARLAREALKTAEADRLAAEKAAQEARRSAEASAAALLASKAVPSPTPGAPSHSASATAPKPTPNTSSSTAEIMSSWDMIGTWATNCRRPPSNQNAYLRFVVMTNGRVSFEHERDGKGIYDVLLANIMPNGSLEITHRSARTSETWKWTIVKGANDSRRIVEISHPDGSNQTIKNGTITSDGRPTLWTHRCR
jgi:hypothetical protein